MGESVEEWADLPATKDQVKALRKMATTTGRTFSTGVTRGQAWRRIARATSILSWVERRRCAPPETGKAAR